MNFFISLQRLLVCCTKLLGTASNTSPGVIQPIPALNPTRLLSLNCFVVGDDPDRMFTVEIEKTKNVSILKDLIKEKKAPHLNHVAASDLDLWKVDFPIDDLPTKKISTDGPKLGPGELLLDVFPPELNIRFIHITVIYTRGIILLIILSLEVVDEGKELGRRDQISALEKSANVFFFFSSCP